MKTIIIFVFLSLLMIGGYFIYNNLVEKADVTILNEATITTEKGNYVYDADSNILQTPNKIYYNISQEDANKILEVENGE